MRDPRTVVKMMALVWLSLLGASPAFAGSSPLGTWVKKSEGGPGGMTLTIEEWGPGKAKLTWRLASAKTVLTLVSKLDGSPAPLLIDGKPSGETMAIKLVDKRHTSTTVADERQAARLVEVDVLGGLQHADRRERHGRVGRRQHRRQVDRGLGPQVTPVAQGRSAFTMNMSTPPALG
jgi:hypothetical protein